MATKSELIPLSGPLALRRIRLDPEERLLIGRTSRGLNLPDPQVSRRHAEVFYDAGSFWIVDLNSMTGTLLDGKPVGTTPMALKPGSKFAVGESVFEFAQGGRGGVLRYAPAVAVALVIFVSIGYFGYQVGNAAVAPKPPPMVRWMNPVNQGGVVDPNIVVDQCFMRETGQSEQALTIRRVTDFNEDGVDEIWLSYEKTSGMRVERAYTFGDDGTWLLLGEFPAKCLDASRGLGAFPGLRCADGSQWEFYEGALGSDDPTRCAFDFDGGRYIGTGFSDSSIVAWINDPGGTIPNPYRMTMVRPDTLAGFLSERGIDDPVHFLVCEDAIPGVDAHVLTSGGRIEPLAYGCLRDINLEGADRREVFQDRIPAMVAFTSIGRQKLLEQIAVFQAGSIDDIWWAGFTRQVVRNLARDPQIAVTVLLSFHTSSTPFFNPVAPERERLHVRGRLEPTSGGPPLQTMATTKRLLYSSSVMGPFPTLGCGEIEVQVAYPNWECNLQCTAQTTFFRLVERGCKDMKDRVLLEAPMRHGLSRVVVPVGEESIEVRAFINADGDSLPIRIREARIGWRRLQAMPAPVDQLIDRRDSFR